MWNDWRNSYRDWTERGTELRGESPSWLNYVTFDKLCQIRLKWRWFLCVCAINGHEEWVVFHQRKAHNKLLEETCSTSLVTDVRAKANISSTWTCCTVSSDLINVQVNTRGGRWKQMLPLTLTHIHAQTQTTRCQQTVSFCPSSSWQWLAGVGCQI